MAAAHLVFFTLLGLLVGSFANVVICRLPRGESIIYPPSHCPFCCRRLGALELIPVLSYLFLRGRCRYCGAPISWRYPLVEASVGAAYAGLYLVFGLKSVELIPALVLTPILLMEAAIDLDYGRLPNALTLSLALAGLALNLALGRLGLVQMALAVLAGGGLLFLPAIFGGMGGGDVKLGAAIGLYLGWQGALLALFLAAFLAALAGLLLVARGHKDWKSSFPFGPFLAVGGFISYLWGWKMIFFYLNLVGLR